MRIFLLLVLFVPCFAVAQKSPIQSVEISIPHNPSSDFQFPVLQTGDRQIDSLFNVGLKVKFFGQAYAAEPLEAAFSHWNDGALHYLDYEVVYADERFISFSLFAEACGANCSFWNNYYTFSLRDGRWLELGDVVDLEGALLRQIEADKDSAFVAQTKVLDELLEDEAAMQDLEHNIWATEVYIWATWLYESCRTTFYPSEYLLHPDYLEIFVLCPLPNAIKNHSLHISLKYNYEDIQDYLKMNIK